ncbi:hypothetical protein ACGFNU_04000 [Spirillospora sp. NPDC048911]|uniref:hypothetical protein n=1 Tax=Spirillospora sp. NPDC048911 TaxID=3364527 RepID=UPI0037110349
MTIPGGEGVALVEQREREQLALVGLRVDFPGYRITRGRRHDDAPGSWVAALHDPVVGVDPTVIASTAADLRAALEDQRRRARDGEKPLIERYRP